MESKQRDTVYGYIRRNRDDNNISIDIINIIYKSYLIRLDSKILTTEEQTSFLDLIFDTLKQHLEYNFMHLQLLYRVSENEYKAQRYHELCEEKGATITIII